MEINQEIFNVAKSIIAFLTGQQGGFFGWLMYIILFLVNIGLLALLTFMICKGVESSMRQLHNLREQLNLK